MKWPIRFMQQARLIAQSSKDPSTKTGCVIVDQRNRVVAQGFNGFPRGVEDSAERLEDRAVKYKLVVHAETNAVIFAQRDLTGCTAYVWPWMPCASCAGVLIQAGIRSVTSIPADPERQERWKVDHALAEVMFAEAGVTLALLPNGALP